MAKTRADLLLVRLGLVPTRTKAQSLIMAGLVLANDMPVLKSGDLLPDNVILRLKGPAYPWVSRGGVKLDYAITHFGISFKDCVVLDVGASTGGFVDVALHYGAKRVYALDVGKGQLHSRLQQDPRVIVLDGLNARLLTIAHVPEPLDRVVVDASFISLKKVLPVPLTFCKPDASLVALIKPQFEVGKGLVPRGGVVRDPSLHQSVCDDIRSWITGIGFHVVGIVPSPITGMDGNKEFLLYATQSPPFVSGL